MIDKGFQILLRSKLKEILPKTILDYLTLLFFYMLKTRESMEAVSTNNKNPCHSKRQGFLLLVNSKITASSRIHPS